MQLADTSGRLREAIALYWASPAQGMLEVVWDRLLPFMQMPSSGCQGTADVLKEIQFQMSVVAISFLLSVKITSLMLLYCCDVRHSFVPLMHKPECIRHQANRLLVAVPV